MGAVEAELILIDEYFLHDVTWPNIEMSPNFNFQPLFSSQMGMITRVELIKGNVQICQEICPAQHFYTRHSIEPIMAL